MGFTQAEMLRKKICFEAGGRFGRPSLRERDGANFFMPGTAEPKTKVRAIETEWLAVAMARHFMGDTDVEHRCGFRPGYLKFLRATGFGSRPARAKIESAVNTPLWSTTRVFHLRCKAEKLFGFNPGAVTEQRLRVELRKLGIDAPADASLDQCEELFLQRIAVMGPDRTPNAE